MSALAFLTPAVVGAVALAARWSGRARAAGRAVRATRRLERAGRLPSRARARADSRTVAFADRSQLDQARAPGGAGARWRRSSRSGDGAAPERAARAARSWWCPVTPSRVLVLATRRRCGRRARSRRRETAASTVVDVTCGLAALALIGPGASELLARFCAIDVRPAVMPVAALPPGLGGADPGLRAARGRAPSCWCSSAGRSASTCGRSSPTPPSISAAARSAPTRCGRDDA